MLIVGVLTTMAAGLGPRILPPRQGRPFGLTNESAASSPLGMLSASVCFVFASRMLLRRSGEAPGISNA